MRVLSSSAVMVSMSGEVSFFPLCFEASTIHQRTCTNIIHPPHPAADTWEEAKTMAECYDYLFELAVKMKMAGLDPEDTPPYEK
jgi:hypothetical protein